MSDSGGSSEASGWRYDEFVPVGKDYGLAEEAAVYDESHGRFRDVSAEDERALAALQVGVDSRVVEFGCGTGSFAVRAARAGARVAAIDVSPAMLAAARRRAASAGVADWIRFTRGGFLTAELDAGGYDAALSSLSLHHLPDFWKGVALGRVRAALRPGGRFFLRDVIFDDDASESTIAAFVAEQDRRGGERWGAFLRDDAESHFREEFSTFAWIMDGLLERSGFRIEERRRVSATLYEYGCLVPKGEGA